MRAFAAVIAAIAAAGSSYGSLAQAPAFTRFRHHHGYDPLPVPSRPLNQERLDKAFAKRERRKARRLRDQEK